jgi:hypothetical protein
MSCEICGRGNCTRSFHSLESQKEFDNVADSIKERMRNIICKRLEKLNGEYIEDVYYIKLSDAIDIVENY